MKLIFATGVVALAGVSAHAAAQSGDVMREPLGSFRLSDALASSDLRKPSVRTFQAEGSGRVFRIDQSDREQVLMQIDGLREVWALRLVEGARGDRLYLNDVGREMLKITSYDGVTVYPRSNPMGFAAYELGLSAPIKPPAPPAGGVSVFQESFAQLLGWADGTRFSGGTDAQSFGRWEADAATILHDAIRLHARAMRTAPSALGIDSIRLINADEAGVVFEDGVLTLSVVPSRGFSGRPSSERIQQALRDAGLPRS